MLPPGESFVISGTWEGVQDDGASTHRDKLLELSDLLWYGGEPSNKDIEFDSVSTAVWFLRKGDLYLDIKADTGTMRFYRGVAL